MPFPENSITAITLAWLTMHAMPCPKKFTSLNENYHELENSSISFVHRLIATCLNVIIVNDNNT
jgi:hypothetical protein